MKTLQEVKVFYRVTVNKYHAQLDWMDKYKDRVTPEILAKFDEKVKELEDLGYILKTKYNYTVTFQDKLGDLGTFQEQVVKQLKI